SIVRGQLEIGGPTTVAEIASRLGIAVTDVQLALEQLEIAGTLLRGQFTSAAAETEWCDRRLLARIHRLTLDGLRKQVATVDAAAFMRFLLARHEIRSQSKPSGIGGVLQAIHLLEGFEAPVGSWEDELL